MQQRIDSRPKTHIGHRQDYGAQPLFHQQHQDLTQRHRIESMHIKTPIGPRLRPKSIKSTNAFTNRTYNHPNALLQQIDDSNPFATKNYKLAILARDNIG
ncbi:hypothetical protein Nepgr_030067 [Nepenthes gracilis]|uniref:Uncharacterized protein n=1 Tax=Nepenthes gracilis TaxID=150966 RepID=A0AAD3TFH9_NEPGR|nr:hypothetical protein Nepgr_030067 [Nepenthes gracilis]